MDLKEIEQIATIAFPNASLLSVKKLEGGVSATISALDLEEGGAKRTVVLRQYGVADLAGDPQVALHEGALLAELRNSGLRLPVPECLYVDESGRYIIVSFIEGSAADEPADTIGCVRQMAEILAQVHSIQPKESADFLKDASTVLAEKLQAKPEDLDDSLSETRIRQTLEAMPAPDLKNESTILHGDFWPGNVMLKDGRISGVIDWEDAMIGDPLVDFANGRLEILMLFGEREMNEFTERYKALMPQLNYDNLAYWELFAALCPVGKMGSWGLDDATLRQLQQGHQKFVDQAINTLM